ncbi:DUF3089 domain-containing protein [bacterium]|nr:DUF3089 domain-containing protein [bacterium]
MLSLLKERRRVIAAGVALLIAVVGATMLLGRPPPLGPGSEFADTAVPLAPDYTSSDAWLARPKLKPPGAWERPWGVDVFFIAPGGGPSGASWNHPAAGPEAGAESSEVLHVHAGAFDSAGALYAPRYRSAVLAAERRSGADETASLKLAYSDILAAFDRYMAEDNQGRALVIAGVSQGAMHAARLIRDRVSTPTARERLVAAYLIDWPVSLDLLSSENDLPACASADQFSCVIAWRTTFRTDSDARTPDFAPVWGPGDDVQAAPIRSALCVNPLNWGSSEALAPRTVHLGAARAAQPAAPDAPADRPTIELMPASVSARCRDGALELAIENEALKPSDLWGKTSPASRVNAFYQDIAVNVGGRARSASAWLDEHARKPAPPLPPVQTIVDSPIRTPIDPVP